MSKKKYWQSFGEHNDKLRHEQLHKDEFKEQLPFEEFSGNLLDAKSPRRDFLKYLGFSTAAATLAASCKTPVRKAVPYASKPENMIPGVAKYYATTFVNEGEVIPIIAKVRDGRPIKIEGNELSKATNGGTSARAQASVLDLYDLYRIKNPKQKTAQGFVEISSYSAADKMISESLLKLTGLQTILLSETVVSPSTKYIISKFPGLQHIQYDDISYSGMLEANEKSGFGKRIPSYKFDTANVIVSLGADFIGTWLNPTEFAAAYVKGRSFTDDNVRMNKHYQFEGNLSNTGACADERFTHRPSQTGAVALALLAAINGNAITGLNDEKLVAGIKKVAAELRANSGSALVVCGSNDANIQTIVNAINNSIGAYGKTINFSNALLTRAGSDVEFTQLLADMEAGKIGAIFIHQANPAYTHPLAERFKKALSNVKLSVSFSSKMDETARLCQYILPDHHYLESWGDAEPKNGTISFIQPTIYPLFKTRPYQTSLLKWSNKASGTDISYEDFFKTYWTGRLKSTEAYNNALQNGVLELPVSNINSGTFNSSNVLFATTTINANKIINGDEIVLYQKVSIGNGAQAGNPWLQELPDSISKVAWDNYALISMSKAKELGIELNTDYEYHPEKPVIKISSKNYSIELPILVLPGMQANTIAVALGYGRDAELGKTAEGVGKNAYPFAILNGSSVIYSNEITITDAKRKEKIARHQIHNSYENRFEVVRETTLATFKKDPEALPDYRKELREDFAKVSGNYGAEATLYHPHDQPGLKWGMNIDMNACVSCSACVVSCHAENNVPVVGKREVMRAHDMHWLRIDRYFVTDDKDADNLKGVVFQPMMCQHCDNAPCENVCPVAATNHSSEGINQMAYNRCIGTRYCANNCPFKVRRFNWANYTGADSFSNNQDQKIVGRLDEVVFQMNDDLTRMVLNPDVTVRSRGVMEKCSFCIQKIQSAKLEAKKENRILVDNNVKTACQVACPTNAITFGNVHDKTSNINKVRKENDKRLFNVLDQLHVLPNVTYLAKVRNTEEIIEEKKQTKVENISNEEKKLPTGNDVKK